ncbi:hypothetical protein BD560DRAFT_396699 [Blakeslea trispora]|nr:hypothetical protein BD560DRAFT_396699 [Blakeslea trispora]
MLLSACSMTLFVISFSLGMHFPRILAVKSATLILQIREFTIFSTEYFILRVSVYHQIVKHNIESHEDKVTVYKKILISETV